MQPMDTTQENPQENHRDYSTDLRHDFCLGEGGGGMSKIVIDFEKIFDDFQEKKHRILLQWIITHSVME